MYSTRLAVCLYTQKTQHAGWDGKLPQVHQWASENLNLPQGALTKPVLCIFSIHKLVKNLHLLRYLVWTIKHLSRMNFKLNYVVMKTQFHKYWELSIQFKSIHIWLDVLYPVIWSDIHLTKTELRSSTNRCLLLTLNTALQVTVEGTYRYTRAQSDTVALAKGIEKLSQ
jgi:hypothetical protein